MHKARESAKHVIFNPAPAVQLPLDAFRDMDTLIMNETEAIVLAGQTVSSSIPNASPLSNVSLRLSLLRGQTQRQTCRDTFAFSRDTCLLSTYTFAGIGGDPQRSPNTAMQSVLGEGRSRGGDSHSGRRWFSLCNCFWRVRPCWRPQGQGDGHNSCGRHIRRRICRSTSQTCLRRLRL